MFNFTVTANTISYLTCLFGIFSMLASTYPFISAVNGMFDMLKQNNGEMKKSQLFKILLKPFLIGMAFIILVNLIDIGFSSKRGFMIGTNTGLIAQFWSYDFYEIAINATSDSVRNGMLKWLYASSAIVKITYPLIIMYLFLSYYLPVLWKGIEDKERDMATMNSGSKSMTIGIAVLSISTIAILVFVAYSGFASFVMFHDGVFAPLKSLGYAFQLGASKIF